MNVAAAVTFNFWAATGDTIFCVCAGLTCGFKDSWKVPSQLELPDLAQEAVVTYFHLLMNQVFLQVLKIQQFSMRYLILMFKALLHFGKISINFASKCKQHDLHCTCNT